MTSSMSNMIRPCKELYVTLRTLEVVLGGHHFLALLWMVTVTVNSVSSIDAEPEAANLASDMIAFRIAVMYPSLVSF